MTRRPDCGVGHVPGAPATLPDRACPAHRRGAARTVTTLVRVKICVLAGGVGGARFLLGARRLLGLDAESARAGSPHRIDAVVNVGDDAWMHGVRICPDLDTCMYTLGGGIDPERGWGHAGETWNCRDELAAYGVQPDWFGLGDKDLATHLVLSLIHI